VTNNLSRKLCIASYACLLEVIGCSTFDASPQQNRTAGYVDVGPQTYNTESRNFERQWPFGPESDQQ
jgi:hypothetical protein